MFWGVISVLSVLRVFRDIIHYMRGKHLYMGIDEVGRGPLAGPAEVCAVLVPETAMSTLMKRIRRESTSLKDSKKLSELQREYWEKFIRSMKDEKILFYASARATPKTIDAINISKAVNVAAEKAIKKALDMFPYAYTHLSIASDEGIRPDISGILSCKTRFRSYVRGDERIPLISIASIVAKVSRDAYMKKIGAKYPHYRFEKNKGYGTRDHILALRRHGPSPMHRLTFIGNFPKIG